MLTLSSLLCAEIRILEYECGRDNQFVNLSELPFHLSLLMETTDMVCTSTSVLIRQRYFVVL